MKYDDDTVVNYSNSNLQRYLAITLYTLAYQFLALPLVLFELIPPWLPHMSVLLQ
jgi:hypothetical protein